MWEDGILDCVTTISTQSKYRRFEITSIFPSPHAHMMFAAVSKRDAVSQSATDSTKINRPGHSIRMY